jgi:hypothetical protein
VENTGTAALFPQLAAVTRDGAGHPNGVGSSNGLCGVPAFPGGFTYSGYIMASADPVSTMASESIEAVVEDRPTDLQKLSVSGVVSTPGSGGMVRVTGNVTDTLSQAVSVLNVCAGAYDAAGNVIGALPSSLSLSAGGLAAGASTSFTIDVPAFGTSASAKAIAAGKP